MGLLKVTAKAVSYLVAKRETPSFFEIPEKLNRGREQGGRESRESVENMLSSGGRKRSDKERREGVSKTLLSEICLDT